MIVAFSFISLVVLLAAGLPVAVGLGIPAMIAVAWEIGPRVFVAAGQVMVDGLNSFVLIAAPMFMLAGEIMNQGGMTRRIFRFASALVGWLPGGLGQVNVVASMLFSGMTGSAVSDAAGLGTVEIQAMRERGYDINLSAAITGASSVIGPIVPPSVPMVIYGALAGVSIGSLFLAGIVPGLLMGLSLMVAVYVAARKGQCPKEAALSGRDLWQTMVAAVPSLLTPVFVIGGIYTGMVTPTEAAVLAAAYSLVLTFVYGEMSLAKLVDISVRVVSASGALFFIVAATSLLGWMVARSGVMIEAALWVTGAITNQTILMLLISAFYLLVGLFMEPIAALILLVPIVLPAVKLLQIDLVYFGVVTVLSLCIGLLTPPVGLVLYIVARIADVSLDSVFRATLPFLIPLMIVLLAVVLFPDLVLFLPKTLYALARG